MRSKEEMNEKRLEILAARDYRCERCGKQGTVYTLELAHRIMQSRTSEVTRKYIQKYVLETYNEELTRKEALEVLHDNLNFAVACKNCNSSFNIFNNPEKTKKLIRDIIKKQYGWEYEEK